MNKEIYKEVYIEGVKYVFVFKDNSACFFIDYKNSDNVKLDNYVKSNYSYEWNDYEAPDEIFSHVNLGVSFKLKKHVLSFLNNVVGTCPYYFKFSAFEDKNVELWGKIAKRYADKYGYNLNINGNIFEFIKKI